MSNLISVVALLVGLGVGYFIASFIKNKELALKETELGLTRNALNEKRNEPDQLDKRFKAVAADVLHEQSAHFQADFEAKDKSISNTVEELRKKIGEFEKERAAQAGALQQSVQTVLDTGTQMNAVAMHLKTVLSSASSVRGRWGENSLRLLLEQAELTEGIGFHSQNTIVGEDGGLRPDFIINLPGGLKLAIDSKAGLEEYFKASEEKDDEKKKLHMVKFAQNIRGHIQDLSAKEYQKHLDTRIPYVIMFVPSEPAVRAVFDQDPSLYNDAQAKKVMIASPATIMPMMLLIAHAWRQQKTTENVTKLAKEITELGGRLKTFLGHVVGIGTSISGATKKFNEAVASWDTRVSPKIEQINLLGGNMQIDENPAQIEIEPRSSGKLLDGPSK